MKTSAKQTDYKSRDPDRQEVCKTDEEAGRRWRTWSALNNAVLG